MDFQTEWSLDIRSPAGNAAGIADLRQSVVPVTVAQNHQWRREQGRRWRFVLTVRSRDLLNSGHPFWDRLMFEAITAFLLVLSVGILVAHALDAFR
jgi:hypothetical protein